MNTKGRTEEEKERKKETKLKLVKRTDDTLSSGDVYRSTRASSRGIITECHDHH